MWYKFIKNIKLFLVFAMYADAKVDDDGVEIVQDLEDEPDIALIELFGQFLFQR